MREPTDLYEAFGWWRDAIAGRAPQITSEPHPGFYQRRFVRGGVFVPVAIFYEQEIDEGGELSDDERLVCLINGEPADAEDQWSYCAGHPITEAEYRFLESRHKWARAYAPTDPFAAPSRKVDFNQFPADF
jgi:hypothetical protein